MRRLKRLLASLEYRWARSSSERFNRWLRKKGCKVGTDVTWHGLSDCHVDVTRPSLVEIGNNVCFTRGVIILTHSYDWFVFRNLYDSVVPSSGRVRIGSNIFVGTRALILQGVTIGDNCVIGAGSIVTKSIPANSVAVGVPARVVCSIEEYFERRKKQCIDEALDYARSIRENLGRDPIPSDFFEEFPLFLRGDEQLPGVPLRRQLGPAYDHYRATHMNPVFAGFNEFLRAAELQRPQPEAGATGNKDYP